MRFKQYIACLLLAGWHPGLYAEFSQEQLDWLNSDAEHPAMAVNEGELEFLSTQPVKAEHHQSMQIRLTQESIDTGWARVEQCHRDLDAVPSLEVVFHKQRVRKLRVTRFSNIEQASVLGNRVLVNNIMRGSEICISAESRLLHSLTDKDGQQRFEMKNGPFMRRFLDGYYPLTLNLEVEYPPEILQMASVQPVDQNGWQISYDAGRITMSGRFEGRLVTRVYFNRLR